MQASHEGLSLIVRHAGGSARDALGLLEQVAALGHVTDSGHWTQQEQPEQVNRLLVDFLG